MKRWIALLLALACCGCPQRPEADLPAPTPTLVSLPTLETRPMAEWTLIFYFAADNDLEAAELDDLEELTQLEEPSEQVRILALVDRSPLGEPSEGYSHRAVANMPNWSHSRLLEVKRDKLVELEDWGRLSMADPQTLRRLLTLAQEKFPSRRRALFLVNHGQAWAGICSDESSSEAEASLDLKDLRDALSVLPQPLDLLTFDACMMSSLEVYLACAPYARYLVASQDSLPSQGLNYREALTDMEQADGLRLGRRFLEAYRQSLKSDPKELARVQLTLLDGTAGQRFSRAWQDYSLKLARSAPKHWLELARSRARAQSFRVENGPRHGAEVHDLGQLLDQIRKALGISGPRDLLKEVVVDQVRGRFRQRCSGLSVFFPPQAEYLRESPQLDYPAQVSPLAPGWVDFLKEYTRLEPRYKGPRAMLSEVSLSSSGAQIDMSARLGQAGTISRSYTILTQNDRVKGQLTCALAEGSTVLSDFFDGRWLFLKEKNAAAPGLMAQLQSVEYANDSSPVALATLACQLKRKDDPSWHDVQLYFALEPEQPQKPARFAGASRSSGLGWTDIRLHSGDEIAFLENDLRPGNVGKRGPSLKLKHIDQLQLVSSPVPRGNYALGFLVVDVQGRRHWRTRPLLWGE